MDIVEMHVMFRQYAQQMGLQNARAILPEQIDILLNTAQMDVLNQTIKENIISTNDRVVTDNSKLGQVNALRKLYKVALIDMCPPYSNMSETRAFNFSAADRNTGRMTTDFAKFDGDSLIPKYMFLVDFSLNYKQVVNHQGYSGEDYVQPAGVYSVLTVEGAIDGKKDYLYTNLPSDTVCKVETYVKALEDFAMLSFKPDGEKGLKCQTTGYTDYYLGIEGINSIDSSYNGKKYVLTKTWNDGDSNFNGGKFYNPMVLSTQGQVSGYKQPSFAKDTIETNFFPVRLIDDTFLADTLNDFVLKNRLRSPIMVTYSKGDDVVFDLYIDKFNRYPIGDNYRYVLTNDLVPYKLRMTYIAEPRKIKYAEDVVGENVDSDLPEYMHVDIVKHAVALYQLAISGNLQAAQQQEQTQQREAVRNNYANQQQ